MSFTLTNKNVIFVAGLGGIGLDTSKELVKRDLKVGLLRILRG